MNLLVETKEFTDFTNISWAIIKINNKCFILRPNYGEEALFEFIKFLNVNYNNKNSEIRISGYIIFKDNNWIARTLFNKRCWKHMGKLKYTKDSKFSSIKKELFKHDYKKFNGYITYEN